MRSPTEGAAAAILDDTGRLLVIQENYGRRRFGYPGGAVEAGESPEDGALRELHEETGVRGTLEGLIGTYALVSGLTVYLFAASIEAGEPAVPDSDEVALVAWYVPAEIPEPRTNILIHSLPDVLEGARGVTRSGLERFN